MKSLSRILFGASVALTSIAAVAQVTFYDNEGYRGRAFTANGTIDDLARVGFNDKAASAVVTGGRWEVCTDAGFSGDCRVLRAGSYESLNGMGLGDRISSVRPVGGGRQNMVEAPAPVPAPTYEYRQRPSEKLYQADVTSSRAIYGADEQRCWVDRQQVTDNSGSRPNVGGAIIGGILGGVIGHQIGSGRGNSVATGIGAVGGAAIGANAGRDNNNDRTYTQDVQKCASVPGSGQPAYWDVEYIYNGQTHRMQMTQPPGRSVTVNRQGEPRG
jgi:uncharacterized protein YcfJ